MDKIICGILQIGIGVPDLPRAFAWYRRYFGMDIPIVQDEGDLSAHMLPLTGGQRPHRQLAIIVNLQGGGGLEICQLTGTAIKPPDFEPQLGDCGINLARIKARDVRATHRSFKNVKLDVLSDVVADCSGREHFFVRDDTGAIFQITQADDWFSGGRSSTGGVCGFMAGVADMERSIEFYTGLLGYDAIVYDEQGVFGDLCALPGGRQRVRRVLLTHTTVRTGSFSRFLGISRIELIQLLERRPRRIYDGRIWGDQGFFQVAFDIKGMEALEQECRVAGHPFSVDSKNSVKVGEASGHYSYITDPDGTWIEFIETYRIPLIRGTGWCLDVRKRRPEKSIPDWMIRTLTFNRVKD